jgi:hypothetical protein
VALVVAGGDVTGVHGKLTGLILKDQEDRTLVLLAGVWPTRAATSSPLQRHNIGHG